MMLATNMLGLKVNIAVEEVKKESFAVLPPGLLASFPQNLENHDVGTIVQVHLDEHGPVYTIYFTSVNRFVSWPHSQLHYLIPST